MKTATKPKASTNGKHHAEPKSKPVPALAPKDAIKAKLAGIREQPLALKSIRPSPLNYRKTFKAGELESLADTIREFGVLQAIIVRKIEPVKYTLVDRGRDQFEVGPLVMPWGTKPVFHIVGEDRAKELVKMCSEATYEIAAGERRFLASRMARLEEIPAKVADLDDADVRKIGLIENAQRAAVDALEEAAGYQAMIDNDGATVDSIRATTGKSGTMIRTLLKLQQLPQFAIDMLREGHLPMTQAGIIARVPGYESRLVLTYRTLIGGEFYMSRNKKPTEKDAREAIEGGAIPLSVRDLTDLVHDEYMVELKGAPFDRLSLDLVKEAGSCEDCPKRSGNLQKTDPDAYADVREDMCTDPGCFKLKVAAAKTQEAEGKKEALRELRLKGYNVLEPSKAKKIFRDGEVDPSSGWLELDAVCSLDKNKRTFRKLLGIGMQQPIATIRRENAKLLDRQSILLTAAQDLSGRVHYMVPMHEVETFLKADHKIDVNKLRRTAGEQPYFPQRGTAATKKSTAEAELEGKIERETETRLAAATARQVGILAEDLFAKRRGPSPKALSILRLVVGHLIEFSDVDVERMAARLGVKAPYQHAGVQAILKVVDELDAASLLGLAAEAVVTDGYFDDSNAKAIFKQCGIDRRAVEKEVTKELADAAKGGAK